MSGPSPATQTPEARPRWWPGVALEVMAVLTAGALLGSLANALSPRGLQWTRNYFPVGPAPRPAVSILEEASLSPEVLAAATARIEARGYTAWNFDRVAEAFADPARLVGRIVFVDARADIPYRRGHIPGARPLDPYRPDQHLLEVVAACWNAERVIVYCSGGTCEDAELAAALLEQAGIPRGRLVIYVGGFSEWLERGQPVEPPRNSQTVPGPESGP